MPIRKLRSINETLKEIKILDPETAITKYMIATLIKEQKIYFEKRGNKTLIDYFEVIRVLGVFYDWLPKIRKISDTVKYLKEKNINITKYKLIKKYDNKEISGLRLNNNIYFYLDEINECFNIWVMEI